MKKLKDIEQEFEKTHKEHLDLDLNEFYDISWPEVKQFYRQAIKELIDAGIGEDRPLSKDDWMGKHQPKEIQKIMDDYRSGYNQRGNEIRAKFQQLME